MCWGRRLAVGLLCLLNGVTLLCGDAWAATSDPVIVIKFSHVVAPDTPKGKAADYFKALAEARSGGKVRVEVYPNSQLYKDKEEMEALQLGAVQMLAPSLAKFGPLGVKEFEVFDLPYIFPSKEVLRSVTEGPIGRSLLRKLESKGIVGLAYWDNGFKIMSANRPLHRPGDVKGLRMRIQSSKVLDAEMRALEASPQVIAFSDVTLALAGGVVDGTENPPSNMYTQRMHEVQRYAVLSNHGYLGYAVIVSRKFWESLPSHLRTILEGAMAEATQYADTIAQAENDEALAAMTASGRTEFYRPTPDEMAEWRRALRPVQRDMAGLVGKDLIDAIAKESARYGFPPQP